MDQEKKRSIFFFLTDGNHFKKTRGRSLSFRKGTDYNFKSPSKLSVSKELASLRLLPWEENERRDTD